jgi:PAS domain S-box-containing protein
VVIADRRTLFRIRPFVLWAFAILLALAGALTAGAWNYRHQKRILREQAWKDLGAIADLKVRQIVGWRNAKMSEAQFLSTVPSVRASTPEIVQSRLEEGQSGERVLTAFRHEVGAEGVAVSNLEGRVFWSVGEFPPHLGREALGAVRQAAASRRLVMSNFQRDSRNIWLDLVVPVLDPNSRPSGGVVVIRLDPEADLYPLIRSWPVPSATAETLLVRRSTKSVVFLNELRHRKNTALTFSLPIDTPHLPGAVAARGEEETLEGIDYRGVPVLAVTRRVPDSPWAMVAKMDQSESYAEIARLSWVTALQGILLISTFGFGAALLIYRSIAEMRARQQAAEREKLILSQRLDYLSKYANDIILLLDEKLRIVEANDRAIEMYGYTRDELLGLALADLYPPDRRSALADEIDRLRREGQLLQEGAHLRKNGVSFPVEASMRFIQVSGRGYCQAIVRDITERKKAEAQLLKARLNLEERVEERTEQLRRLSAHLEKIKEEEAKRISEEIHEDLGSILAAARFDVTWTRDRLQRASLSVEAGRLESVTALLDRVLDGVRRISQTLRPFVLDQLGLRAALETLAEDFQARHNLRCRMSFAIPDVPSSEWSIAVYRLVEQALTNASLRSGVTALDVDLRVEEGKVRLIMNDDGRFDEEQTGVEDWAVLTMKEAVFRLKGDCAFIAGPPGGFRFEAWFPLPATPGPEGSTTENHPAGDPSASRTKG